jgi:hypothetical protein
MENQALTRFEALRRHKADRSWEIPVRRKCHWKIHKGEYEGIRLQDLAHDFAACPK